MFPLNPCPGMQREIFFFFLPPRLYLQSHQTVDFLKQWVIIRVHLSKVCAYLALSKWGSQTAASAWPGNMLKTHMLQAPTQICQVGNPGGQWGSTLAVLRRTTPHDFDPQASLRPPAFCKRGNGVQRGPGACPKFPRWPRWNKTESCLFPESESCGSGSRPPQFGQVQTFPWADHANKRTCHPRPSAIMPATPTTRKSPQGSSEPCRNSALMKNAVNPVPLILQSFRYAYLKKSTLSSIFHVFPFPSAAALS